MLASAAATQYEVLDRVLFPHSLGIFYTALTQWLGFPHYGDEGKVMGLAPYGDPALHAGACARSSQPHGDLFVLDLDYFTHDEEGVDMTWDDGTPRDRADLLRKRRRDVRPAARRGRRADDSTTTTSPPRSRLRLEEVYLHLVDAAAASGRACRTSASPAASR